MSSTNRGAQRDQDDHYASPQPLADLICQHLRQDWYERQKLSQPRLILEPGCGEGAFMTAAKKAWPQADVFGVEQNQHLAAEAQAWGHAVVPVDYLSFELPDDVRPDLAVTNPPFVLAQEFVEHTIRLLASGGFGAFLLRLNFFGGKARFKSFWNDNRHHRHTYVLPSRASFVPDGKTDSVEYGVFVFSREPRVERATTSFIDNTGIVNRLGDEAVKTTYKPNPKRGKK